MGTVIVYGTGDADKRYVIKGQTTGGEVFVSPTGSDTTGTGLTAGSPFKTFAKAFAYLATQGPILQGQWYVTAAAGTYPITTGQHTMNTRSVLPVIVRGPAVAGGVPTAIIDGGGVAGAALVPAQQYAHGLSAAGIGVQVEFRDLKAINFTAGLTDTTRIGLLGEQGAWVHFNNCHATAATWCGAYAFSTIRAYVTGGIYDGCRSGVVANDTECTVQSGTQIKNSTESGIYWSRGSQGHVDNAIFTDNVRGLYVSQSSRVDTVGNDFKRNVTAIVCDSGGVFGEGGSPNTFGTGVDANTTDKSYMAYSGDTTELRASASATRVGYDRVNRTSTGTTSEVLLSTPYTIPARRMAGIGKTCRVKVDGQWTSVTAGSVVNIKFGGLVLPLTVPAASASTVAFEIVAELHEVQGGYRAFGRITQGASGSRVASVGTGFVDSSSQDVQVTVAAASGADAITLYRSSVYLLG